MFFLIWITCVIISSIYFIGGTFYKDDEEYLDF
jgi:hypothetical protein